MAGQDTAVGKTDIVLILLEEVYIVREWKKRLYQIQEDCYGGMTAILGSSEQQHTQDQGHEWNLHSED